MEPLPIIVGIDPGTTVGYAVIDIDRNLLDICSSKDMGLGTVIQNIIKSGSPILVGCDKSKPPSFAESFAIKVGARLVYPDSDLKVEEKKQLAKGFAYSNDHEMDALASALFAYRRFYKLISKVNTFVNVYNKHQHRDSLVRLLITAEGINIRQALQLIESPDSMEARIIKHVVSANTISKKDYILLYKKISVLEKELAISKLDNASLKSRLNLFSKPTLTTIKLTDAESRQKLGYKERTISMLNCQLAERQKQIELLNKKLGILISFVSRSKFIVFLKKLDNLSSHEFEKKNRILNIGKADILLVGDLSVYSDSVLNRLKGVVNIIVHKKQPTNFSACLPFILIKADKLRIEESDYFAAVELSEFESVKNSQTVFDRIISNYKSERIEMFKSERFINP